MTTRRGFLVALGAGALATPLACFAQQQRPKVARVGLLAPTPPTSREALIAGLRELGYVEGKNLIIEYRWAEGKYERLPGLAADLVKTKVDVILATTALAVQAAQGATTTIPIVMVATADPVGNGFVASLSRPGRNITGLSNLNQEVSSKYLELLRDAVPKLSRVTVLANPNHPNFSRRIEAAEKPGNLTISRARAATVSELDAAFAAMKEARAGALIVLPDPFFFSQTRRIVELATQHRLPTMFFAREFVESGGLMSYGQNAAEHYYRAATYIDKILKGVDPRDLPVEQSTKFELVVNLKTAKALGLAIPQELLLRADKVIE